MGFISDLFGSPKNNFQAKTVPLTQANYSGALQGAIGQPQQTINQQQQLAEALQQQMQGGGPNLAATQLQAATDRNNQQAAGLIGSQRGLSPALAARQILSQQAQNSQASANQAAQLRQQQQLSAQQQLGNVLGQQGQLGLGQIGELGQLQNQQNALNLQQSLGTQGLNLQAQESNQKAQSGITGGLLSGLGSIGSSVLGLDEGGYIQDMTSGGPVPGQAKHSGDHPDNDTVPAMLSPGEIVIPRSLAKDADPKEIKKFIEALKREKSEDEPSGYGKVVRAKKKLGKYQGGEC